MKKREKLVNFQIRINLIIRFLRFTEWGKEGGRMDYHQFGSSGFWQPLVRVRTSQDLVRSTTSENLGWELYWAFSKTGD